VDAESGHPTARNQGTPFSSSTDRQILGKESGRNCQFAKGLIRSKGVLMRQHEDQLQGGQLEPLVTEPHSHELTVMGPGAVGGLLAAMLERRNEPVTVVARSSSLAEIQKSGLTIESPLLGSWTSWPVVSSSVSPGAVVLLAVKATGLADAVDLLKQAGPSQVYPVLNGLQHIAALRSALPHADIVPATITVEALRLAATSIEHKSPFVRVTVPDAYRASQAMTSLISAGVDVVSGGTETEVMWRKYRFLAPMALLTALHQRPLGQALTFDRVLTRAVVAEVAALATAAGVATGTEELLAVLEGLPPKMRSSLQVDLGSGRPSELEAIGGGLLLTAREHSMRLPATEEVVRDLREQRDALRT
jgi:2-dehydropantoate 2-reductase